jgi:hypothetical protein
MIAAIAAQAASSAGLDPGALSFTAVLFPGPLPCDR